MKLNFLLKKRIKKGRRTASRIFGRVVIIELLGEQKIRYRSSEKEYKIDCVNTPPFDEKRFYTLDREGLVFWKLLKNNPKVEEIVDFFVKRKILSRKEAEIKVLKFAAKLIHNRFVDIVEEIT